MFKGISKGILSSSIYLPTSKVGDKKGLNEGISKSANLMNRTKLVDREKVFEFYTTHVGTFAVIIAKTGQVAEWDFGDGQRVIGNSASITYTAAGKKKVRLFVDDFRLVTGINQLFGINIVGTLDLRPFRNATSFQIYDNTNVTKVLMPRPSKGVIQANQNFRTYNVESLDLSMMENMTYIAATGTNLRRGINFPRSTNFTYFEINSSFLYEINLQPLTLGTSFFCGSNSLLKFITFSPSSNSFASFYFNSNTVYVGNLDVSMLTGLGGDMRIQLNTLLTSITFPAIPTGVNFTNFEVNGNNLTGVLNISQFAKLGGVMRFSNNPLLTSIVFASVITGANPVTAIQAFNCNLTGNLDISMFTTARGDIEVNNNPLLTSITFPVSTGNVQTIYCYSCNITGVLDVSSFSNLGNVAAGIDLQGRVNPLLTQVILPSNNNPALVFSFENCSLTTVNFISMPKLTEINACNIRFQNNGMTAAQVNQMLIDLDTNATNAFTGRQIVANGTNAAPTGAGLTAKASLISKGFTVTTN